MFLFDIFPDFWERNFKVSEDSEIFFIASTKSQKVIICARSNNPIEDCEIAEGTSVTDILIENPLLSVTEVEAFRQDLDQKLTEAI